jgi:hypothetical protein
VASRDVSLDGGGVGGFGGCSFEKAGTTTVGTSSDTLSVTGGEATVCALSARDCSSLLVTFGSFTTKVREGVSAAESAGSEASVALLGTRTTLNRC